MNSQITTIDELRRAYHKLVVKLQAQTILAAAEGIRSEGASMECARILELCSAYFGEETAAKLAVLVDIGVTPDQVKAVLKLNSPWRRKNKTSINMLTWRPSRFSETRNLPTAEHHDKPPYAALGRRSGTKA